MGGYETDINIVVPRSTTFMSFLIQKQCDCHSHCLLYLCIRPEKTPITADLRLLSSLPSPTSEIVTDKIPHPLEKCQLKPTTPSGKKDCSPWWEPGFLLEQPLAILNLIDLTFFRTHPSLKQHILFYSNHLAIWQGLF